MSSPIRGFSTGFRGLSGPISGAERPDRKPGGRLKRAPPGAETTFVAAGYADELYRVLFGHVDNMVCTLDLEGRFTSINAAGERLTGFAARELIGRFAVELIAPENRDEAVAQFRRRLETRAELPGDESMLLARDGSCVPIEITSVLLLQDGEPAGVLGLVRDLSERRGAEEALLESEQRFRSAFESAAIGMAVVGLDGRFLEVNDSLCELVGRTADELCTMTWRDITHPDDLGLDSDVVQSLLDGQIRSYQIEKRYRHRLGHDLWALVAVSLVRTRDGEPLHLISQIKDITERKRAEEALAQSQARLAEAQRIGQIGDWKRDGPDQPLTWSEETYRIFGIDPDSGPPSYERLLAAVHPDDRDEFERVVKGCRKDGRSYSHEYRIVLPDGEVRWVHGRGELVGGDSSSPPVTRGTAQDVTERKKAEERLAEAQRIAQVGNWEWHVATDTITWSDELYRIFGLDPRADLPSRATLAEFVHPDDRARVEALAARVRETGEAYTHQYRIVLRNGTTRWIEGRGVATVGVHGLSMRGTVQDVTEGKAAKERLVEAEERYRTLVEQLPLGTYIRPLDMSRPNIYASPQVEPMLGYPAEEWMTNPGLLATIVHPGDRERVLSQAADVRGTGAPLHDEYRYVKPDGSIVWVQDETYVVCDEAGEPRCVQGYLLDITERKLAEEERDRLREELYHAQKLEAVGRLAGGVAHDFNNMLTAIKGYSELLLNGLEPGSPLRAEAEQIHRAAAQASALPRQLLAFSREQVLEPKLIDLNDVVFEATDLIRLLVGADVEFVASPLARPAAVVADPGQVEQVLINLATNARDAMPAAGGTLTIATRNADVDEDAAREHEAAPGRYVVVSVSDNGTGMDPETLPRVFEPFFTTKGPGKGSGLGLPSAYGITKQSGGFIQARSELGSGTTFDVYFPLAVAGSVAADDEPVAKPAVASAPATVLLAEDEEIVRAFAATALERAGYRVLTASRGVEALQLCEEAATGVDVLVSDIVMPGMGGRELAERILARSPATGIVLVSGYTDEPADRDLEGGQVPAFLQKPFSVPALIEAVRDAAAGSLAASVPTNGILTTRSLGISCLVADDHPAVLDSVSRFLEASGIEVVARVDRGDDALAAIEAHRPDVALLDVAMQPLNGIEVSRRAAQLVPECQAILYTGSRDTKLLEQALDAGARGFVLKEAPLSELIRAMRAVASGGTFVDAELSSALATPQTMQALSPLTPRERQVLALVADGMTNDRTAEQLGISAETVQSHVRNAMSKLEADTRTQAVATAIRQALIA